MYSCMWQCSCTLIQKIRSSSQYKILKKFLKIKGLYSIQLEMLAITRRQLFLQPQKFISSENPCIHREAGQCNTCYIDASVKSK